MPKTVSTQLNGGLGNQLFQYATGLYVANLTERKLELDVSRVSRDRTVKQRRNFGLIQLGVLGLTLPLGKVTNRSFLKKHTSFNYLYRKFPNLLSSEFYDLSPNGETGIGSNFNPAIIQKAKSKNIVMRGNMQFLDLALSVQKEYLSKIELLERPSDLFSKQKNLLSNLQVLSIHIRLRDYVTLEDSTQLTHRYYSEAISRATEEIIYDQIWIFSDDISAAKLFMDTQDSTIPIVYHEETDLSDCETLILMSLSHSIISANSTFSLWACILSKSSNIVVPSPWFKNNDGIHIADFNYPPEWKVVQW